MSLPVESPMLDARSRALRLGIVQTFEDGGRGHLGSAFSLVELLRVLFDEVLRLDPTQPRWPERDRFILSKGHGCLALYVLMAEKGFFPAQELQRFCRADGILGGHPEYGKVPGIEASTGSLGHGLPLGVGMALAARQDGSDRHVYVVVGDGETNEGSQWEAALSAAKHRLEHLTLLIDYNKLQSYGPTREVLDLEPLADKWRAFGWGVAEVDGHDVDALRSVLRRRPLKSGAPNVVICHTVKGKGVSFMEHNPHWHHKNKIDPEQLAAIRAELRG